MVRALNAFRASAALCSPYSCDILEPDGFPCIESDDCSRALSQRSFEGAGLVNAELRDGSNGDSSYDGGLGEGSLSGQSKLKAFADRISADEWLRLSDQGTLLATRDSADIRACWW